MNYVRPSGSILLCFGAFAILLAVILGAPIYLNASVEADTRLPILAILGVVVLLLSLCLISVVFVFAGLSDKSQALGLPEGSVRAVIALSLIVLFVILAVFLQNSIGSQGLQRTAPMPKKEAIEQQIKLGGGFVEMLPTGKKDKDNDDESIVLYRIGSQASDDLAKQIFTLVGTLMTAVSSFYFASRASGTGQREPDVAPPLLAGVTPSQGARGTAIDIQIQGKNLQLAHTVKLVHEAQDLGASEVVSNERLIRCTFTLPATLPAATYDLVVTSSDGKTGTLIQSFTVA